MAELPKAPSEVLENLSTGMSNTSIGGQRSPGDGDVKHLMFAPFTSLVSTSFWGKFDEVKVEVLQLNEDPVPICGYYGPHDMDGVNPVLSVDNTSFVTSSKPHFGAVKVPGVLKTTISAEHFRNMNYNELMKSFGEAMLGDLFSDEGLARIAENPSVLGSFVILAYADLKKYKFLFWFGFPAISLPTFDTCLVGAVKPVDAVFNNFNDLATGLKPLASNSEHEQIGFFFINKSSNGETIVKSLKEMSMLNASDLNNTWFGFLDTSTIEGTPSWVLRNFLTFIKFRLKIPNGTEINVLSFRPGRSNQKDTSFVFRVLYRGLSDKVDTLDAAKFIGWEKNDKGAYGPKHADTQATMDPVKLAENSVDFNLRLMKWRLFPEFDLKMMHDTKCLIVGAGTLGCNVARCLMGWGVRKITFVDNGTVSYTNPVRQSLYVFDDCLKGGKLKAEAAADSCRYIFPGMKTEAVKLMIPMPGHPISAGTVDQVRKDYFRMEELVKECDVMFLLMDTRESRWLPTVLGAKYNKIVINAALGFDSYVVMRHGVRLPGSNERNLGCYYCTDVVAPGDSTKDRSLDQQCTVTRPGVSMIAGALAVELLTAILHHPEKALAPGKFENINSSPLGIVPHSLRGFISSCEQISPCFQAYDKCTGCSDKVLTELDSRGFDFIADVLNSSSDYLEQLTGLDKLKNDMTDFEADIVELPDDEDFETKSIDSFSDK